MAKKPISKKVASKAAPKKAPKRRFDAGGVATAEDILSRALAGSGDGDNFPSRRASTASGKSGLPAVRGSRNVARPGRPSIDVDMRSRGLPGSKLAGSGQSDAAAGRYPKLPSPKLDLPSAEEMSGRGNRGSNIGRIAAGAIGAGAGLATQKGIQSLATGPSAGMDTTGTIAALNRSDKGNQRVVMQGDLPVGVAPKRASTGFTDAADVGPPRPLGPTSKPAAPKPVARKPRASADDDFMADLRASAQRMRDTSADMASKTGRMKSAMEEFQSAADDATDGYKRGGKAKGFKQGGSVGGRGDGKAIRGRTKGRFI